VITFIYIGYIGYMHYIHRYQWSLLFSPFFTKLLEMNERLCSIHSLDKLGC